MAEYSHCLQVSGQEDLQRISEVLSHRARQLEHITFEPYRSMLCVCQYSEDGQWYRSQVKGQKLGHLHVCVHTLILATVVMVTFRGEKQ